MDLKENDHTKEQEYIDLQKAKHLKQAEESKDLIRNAEEILESIRRAKVLNGEWEESKSRDLLQKQLFDLQKKYPTEKSIKTAVNDIKKQMADNIRL